jgi:hypothetical protein
MSDFMLTETCDRFYNFKKNREMLNLPKRSNLFFGYIRTFIVKIDPFDFDI